MQVEAPCECRFKPTMKRKDVFVCVSCKDVHFCGVDKCEHLFYNSDHLRVCKITGLCYNQRLCEMYVDTSSAFSNSDPTFLKKQKRPQQIKNKVLKVNEANSIIQCAAAIIGLSRVECERLSDQILKLWRAFVDQISMKRFYVHRKDKKSFVIAIVMSLRNGIFNDKGNAIVKPHDQIQAVRLNKKSTYRNFQVSGIRHGQNLIKRVFAGVDVSVEAAIDISEIIC